MLENNSITEVPYYCFLLLDLAIKGFYPIAYIFQVKGLSWFTTNQTDHSYLQLATYTIFGYLTLVLLMLMAKLLTRAKVVSLMNRCSRFLSSASMITIVTFLAVPIQTIAIANIRLSLQTKFTQGLEVQTTILSIMTLVYILVLFSLTQLFLSQFFPSKRIPWARAAPGHNTFGFITSYAYSVLLSLDHQNLELERAIFIIIVILELANLVLLWIGIPYYNKHVEIVHLCKCVCLSFLYLLSFIVSLDPSRLNTVTFDVTAFLGLFLLLFNIQRLRLNQQRTVFLSADRKTKSLKWQLIEIIRLSRKPELERVEMFQKWLIMHQRKCDIEDCLCQIYDLTKIQNISKGSSYNLDASLFHSDSIVEQPRQLHQDLNTITQIRQQFFMAQYIKLSHEDAILNEDCRAFDHKQIKLFTSMIVTIIEQEIERQVKTDEQLKFLFLCVDISLKSQTFQSLYKIMQLQHQKKNISLTNELIIANLKKFLIEKISKRDAALKIDQEKMYILHQLQYEIDNLDMRQQMLNLTEKVDTLWKLSNSSTYQLLEMNETMVEVSRDFLILWKKLQQNESKFQSSSLLLLLARFCDLVLGFEIEADNLYIKATTIMNGLKLNYAKGMNAEEDIQNRLRNTEFLMSLEFSPNNIDKIIFMNQRLQFLTGYKQKEIRSLKNLLPQVIAHFHDSKLIGYLKNKDKSSTVIEISSYMRVKKGYIIPVEVRVLAHVDIKHDLRFISLIRTRKKLIIDEAELQFSQFFVFLIDKYGHIDSTTKHSEKVLGIHQKMIDMGLTIQQVFVDLSLDDFSVFENGTDFIINKPLLNEIQTQLDLGGLGEEEPADEIGQKNAQRRNSNTKSEYSISQTDVISYLRVFIHPGTTHDHEPLFYEVIAVPVRIEQEAIDQSQSFLQSRHIQSSMIQRFNMQSNVSSNEVDLQEGNNLEDEQLLNVELGSLSSGGSSATSRSDSQFAVVRDIKEMIALESLPPIIITLRRILHCFFMIMLVTAIVLLIVNVLDKSNFERDIRAVEKAFMITYFVANVRLRFLSLYTQSNKIPVMGSDEIETYIRNQYQFSTYVEGMRNTILDLNLAVQHMSDELKGMFYDEKGIIKEISKLGYLSSRDLSFHSGCQEIIQTSDQYQYSSPSQLQIARSIFGIKYGVNVNTTYKLSVDEQNSYFILQNLAGTIRTQSNKIELSFAREVIDYGNTSQQNILIFTMVCIGVVFLSTVFLLKMLFKIDNTLRESVKTWIDLTPEHKEEQIFKIFVFKEMLFSDSSDSSKTQKKSNMTAIMERRELQKYRQEQTVQNNFRKNKPAIELEDVEESKEEEVKATGNKRSKINQKTFSQVMSDQKQKANKVIKEQYEEPDDAGDDAQDQQYTPRQKSRFDSQEQIKFHKQSQIIALNTFTLKRKFTKAVVIVAFSSILSVLYAGSYLLASKIYQDALTDFENLTIISTRAPCPANAFYFLADSFLRNSTKSETIDTDVQYLLDDCLKLESQMRDMKRSPRRNYIMLQQYIDMLDSPDFCDFYELKVANLLSKNAEDRARLIALCPLVSQGILTTGASSTLASLSQEISQLNVFYKQRINYTERDLRQLLYKDSLQQSITLYTSYLGPALNQIYQLAINILYEVIDEDFRNLIVMFAVFIFFLMLTWVISVGVIVISLSNTLIRAKISVKLIPATTLIDIKDIEKGLKRLEYEEERKAAKPKKHKNKKDKS